MYNQHPHKIIAHFDNYQNELLSCIGVEYTEPVPTYLTDILKGVIVTVVDCSMF